LRMGKPAIPKTIWRPIEGGNDSEDDKHHETLAPVVDHKEHWRNSSGKKDNIRNYCAKPDHVRMFSY
jgi:hypothetical protein